jgi:universal stress protein A
MKLNRILCPIDFSLFSKSANFYASLFAQATDAQIIFLSVKHPPSNGTPVEFQLDDLFQKLTFEVRPRVPDVNHVFEVRSGDPANEILTLAKERNVDLIVMGTHGATGIERLLHGSVCGKVMRYAECPVMAVKDNVNVDWISHVVDAANG